MSNENSSYLRFTVEESIWFQKGHEVEELVSISLSPDVVIQETADYVLIRGALELTGEYQSLLTTENEQEFVGTNEKFMEILEVKENGNCFFRYYFPVDITIRREKIVSVHQVDFLVDHFDYHFPERSCLKLTAHLLVTGLMEEAPIRQEWENVSKPAIFTPAAKANKEKVKEVIVTKEEVVQLLENEPPSPPSYAHTQAGSLEELVRSGEEVKEEPVIEPLREETREVEVQVQGDVVAPDLETTDRYLEEDLVIDAYFEEDTDDIEIEVVFEEDRVEEEDAVAEQEEQLDLVEAEVVEEEFAYERYEDEAQDVEEDFTYERYEEEAQDVEENFTYERYEEEAQDVEEDFTYEREQESDYTFEEVVPEVEELYEEATEHPFKEVKVEAIPVYEVTPPPIVPKKIVPFVLHQQEEVVEEVQEVKAVQEVKEVKEVKVAREPEVEENPVPANKSRFGFDLFFSSKKKEVEEKTKEEPKGKETKKEAAASSKMKLTEFFSSKSEDTNVNLKLYFIQPKDTLESIADKYNTSVTSLLKYNKLDSPSALVAGEILYVPSVKVTK